MRLSSKVFQLIRILSPLIMKLSPHLSSQLEENSPSEQSPSWYLRAQQHDCEGGVSIEYLLFAHLPILVTFPCNLVCMRHNLFELQSDSNWISKKKRRTKKILQELTKRNYLWQENKNWGLVKKWYCLYFLLLLCSAFFPLPPKRKKIKTIFKQRQIALRVWDRTQFFPTRLKPSSGFIFPTCFYPKNVKTWPRWCTSHSPPSKIKKKYRKATWDSIFLPTSKKVNNSLVYMFLSWCMRCHIHHLA